MAAAARSAHEHLVGVTLTLKMQKACQERAPEELRAAILARLEQV